MRKKKFSLRVMRTVLQPARRGGLRAMALAALALAACASLAAAQQFALQNGETVVFYGDSITAQRLYTRDVEDFVLTRYPLLRVRFVNAGVPGDTAVGGYAGAMPERVKRDVAPFEPAMITVMLGMNDGGWGWGSIPKIDAEFQHNYNTLLSALRQAAPGAALTLIGPSPYDEITHGAEFPGYARVVKMFADDVARIGAGMASAGGPPVFVADFNGSVTAALQRAREQYPGLAPLLLPDHIHPNETGHWIMAAALLSAWHVNPVVSRDRKSVV
jgi:lysophospholipase L1-like esterase